MPKDYSAQQFFLSIIAAVVIAGVVGYFVGRSTVPVSSLSSESANIGGGLDTSQSSTTMNLSLDQAGSTTATINDQSAGNQVSVVNANFSQGGWLAIYEDRDGTPGNIIGAQYFPAGATASATIDLLRPMVKGTYYARFHKDNGDHQFDLKIDSALLDSSANPMTLKFMAN